MIPTADYFGKIIDCRVLHFSASFYALDEEQALELGETFYTFLNDKYTNTCILLWKMRDRSLKTASSIRATRIATNEIFDITLEGDVKSLRVYNKTSLRKYNHDLGYHPIFHLGLTPAFASIDYPEYARTEIRPFNNDPDGFYKALVELYSLEGRINLSQFTSNDIEARFSATEAGDEEGCPGSFCGSIDIKIGCFCLGDELNNTADELKKFGLDLSNRFNNINIAICIDQNENDYKRHFPSIKEGFVERQYYHKIWMRSRYLYLNNVGWVNIASPLVGELGVLQSSVNENKTFKYDMTHSGGHFLYCSKKISEILISDLKQMKRILYPMLLPSNGGRGYLPNSSCGYRSCWENVPILDSEIIVTSKSVEFKMLSSPNVKYLLKDY